MNKAIIGRNNRNLTIAFATGLLLISSISANATTPYSFVDLGTLGGAVSSATGINNAGQVVGISSTNGGSYYSHATLWNGTTATDLQSTWNSGYSYAFAINNTGQVAGDVNGVATVWNGTSATYIVSPSRFATSRANAINDSGIAVGYVAPNGSPSWATIWNGTTSAFSFDGNNSSATGINNASHVVGYASTLGHVSPSGTNAIFWNGMYTRDLGSLGGTYSFALAINNADQVVGGSNTAGDVVTHATLWDGAVVTDLGTLGGAYIYSSASAINNVGQIVGSSSTLSYGGINHATLWSNGSLLDLNTLLDASTINAGWVLNHASGINDNGWIVGNASNSLLGISSHAFMLQAVPEPNTYAMLIAGLGLMGFTARRKQA